MDPIPEERIAEEHIEQQPNRNKKWLRKWSRRLLTGIILFGGTFAVAYSSASITNHVSSYFTYEPVTLYPHRQQVAVHGLVWLMGAGAMMAIQDLVRVDQNVQVGDRVRDQQPGYHVCPPRSDFWWWYMLSTRPTTPQVVIYNGDKPTGNLSDKSENQESKTESSHPANVVKYEAPGWFGLVTMGAGALFGVYKLWNVIERGLEECAF